jgi:hypothetical protein
MVFKTPVMTASCQYIDQEVRSDGGFSSKIVMEGKGLYQKVR